MSVFGRSKVGLAAVVLVTLCTTFVWAQEEPVDVTGVQKLRFEVTPYFWAIGINGDVTAGGREADVDVDFGDIWDNLDIAFALRAEAWYGKWMFFIDGSYLQVSDDNNTMLGKLEVELDSTMLDFGLGYRVWETAFGTDDGQSVAVDLYGGGRYIDMEVDIELDGRRDVDKSKDWLDPIVGAQVTWKPHVRWAILARGDIGGFGAGSEFTWSAFGGVNYRFTDWFSATVGYKALGFDYEDGSGNRKVEFDLVVHGPFVGVTFSF